MTDEQEFDTDDALAAVEDISLEAGQAQDALERGPSTGEVQTALGRLEENAREVARYGEAIEDAVGDLTGSAHRGGIGDMEQGMEDAYDALNVIRDRTGVIEQALDANDGTASGTLTIEGVEFEVTLERVNAVSEGNNPGYTFSSWLSDRMDEHDISRSQLVEFSLAGRDYIRSILDDGERPVPEVAKSILKGLDKHNYIHDEAREDVLLDFGWTDSDVGVTEERIEEYHSPDSLAALFG